MVFLYCTSGSLVDVHMLKCAFVILQIMVYQIVLCTGSSVVFLYCTSGSLIDVNLAQVWFCTTALLAIIFQNMMHCIIVNIGSSVVFVYCTSGRLVNNAHMLKCGFVQLHFVKIIL